MNKPSDKTTNGLRLPRSGMSVKRTSAAKPKHVVGMTRGGKVGLRMMPSC